MPSEIFWVLVPVTALLIPIVAMFTKHQQRMAEIYHRSASGSNEVAALRHDIAELKSLVHQQAITLDNMASSQRALSSPPPTPNISERLSSN